jgi:hypothetical protein
VPDFDCQLGIIEGLPEFNYRHGPWALDEDDALVIAMLQDPILGAELLWDDPKNHAYGGCYRVGDYQWPLFRPPFVVYKANPYRAYACSRSVGKTESVKAKSFTHAFRRTGEGLLLTAPELIHLLPLTDAVEERIEGTRLTREYLDADGGKTGFTHRPFGCKFKDGTYISGRIPRLKGTGVKGAHIPDLHVDEAQDYPAAGWTEVHETVIKDHVDPDGNPDFTYVFSGVHSGDRGGGFHQRITSGGFTVIRITALQRPGWSAEEKRAAMAAYGGTNSGDYRRNILGESGGAASAYFVLSRLMACVDQGDGNDPMSSKYNREEYRKVEISQEQIDDGTDTDDDRRAVLAALLDLPLGYASVWVGSDLGLTDSPTEILVFAEVKVKGQDRLKLIRRIVLRRARTKTIRWAFYEIARTYGRALQAVGIDSTGLGFPIRQEMEDDHDAPRALLDVLEGHFFNSPLPVHVEEADVTEDETGRMRDRYGNQVKIERDEWGNERKVTYMPMIEASTRFLREWVDSTYLLLPFDTEIVADMTLETTQRVKAIAGMKKKPQALHILDALREVAVVKQNRKVQKDLEGDTGEDVFDIAVEF